MSTTEPTPQDPDALLDVALRVSDGAIVDWETTRPHDSDLGATFDKLRSIAAVAAQHRRDAASPSPTETNATPPATTLFTWGHLRVQEKLGEGGFGEVWRAWDPTLQREVALKLRRADGRGRGAMRWIEEARRLARVRHPHVLMVHGADLHDDRAGIWTDLLRGRTLSEWLRDFGPLGAREATILGMDLCAALSAVHGAGVVHGDVKTTNVMREGDVRGGSGAGRIVLMDFGSAHETRESESPSAGTPLYTSPEVLAGGALTPAADLYALGVLLFRMVTGMYPVDGASVDEIRAQHAAAERRSLRALRPDLPPVFIQVVERALEPDPARRFGDAAEMERALATVLGATTTVRPRARFDARVLAAVFACGAAFGIAAWWVGVHWSEWITPEFRVAQSGAPVVQSLKTTFSGSDTRGSFGHAVENVGDVNGDSIPDMLVSAPNEDGVGAAYLHLGRRGAEPQRALRIRGENPGDEFGCSIAGGGDLNGDGYDDFVVGAQFADNGVIDSGRVYVWFGRAAPREQPDVVLDGSNTGQLFGHSVASRGDVNGDGYDDLAVGAPLDGGGGFQTGRAYVFWGGAPFDTVPDLNVSSSASTSQFGIFVELGDLNGDGFDEVFVGANWENTDAQLGGRVYAYFGGRTPDATPDLTFRSPFQSALFGYPLCAADVNADGYDDLAVGVGGPEKNGATAVRVFFGGPRPDARSDVLLRGAEPGDAFGYGIESADDVNGDGLVDLLIAAPYSNAVSRDAGAAYVYFGGRRMDEIADIELLGDAMPSLFGNGMAALGDVDGDGFGDVTIGAPQASGDALGSGKLYVFDFERYVLSRPRPGDVLRAGTENTIAWFGAEPADVSLSTDGGRTFTTIQSATGGRSENVLALSVASAACDSAYLRLTPSRSGVHGEARVGPVRIVP